MQLIADCCKMPVQLPFSSSASVVLGSAMLGAMAYKDAERGIISTQVEAGRRSEAMKDELWNTMVGLQHTRRTSLNSLRAAMCRSRCRAQEPPCNLQRAKKSKSCLRSNGKCSWTTLIYNAGSATTSRRH